MNLNNSLKFNGKTDYVDIPDNSAYSIITNNALSISFWMNPDTLSMPTQEDTGYVMIISKNGSGTNEWLFRMYQTGNTENRRNRISFYTFNAAGGIGDGVYCEEEVIPGQWMHLCATVDSAKEMRLYKNGVLKDVATSTMTFTDTASTVRIGTGRSNSVSNTSYFKGKIDDVRIYKVKLTAEQVENIYKTNSVASEKDIVGWWKLDEVSGTTITDSSSTANNGTLNGGDRVPSLVRGRIPLLKDIFYYSTSLQTVVKPNTRLIIRNIGSKSLLFNGTSDYLTVGGGYTLNTSAFSMSFWFNVNNFNVNDRLVDIQDAGPSNGASISIQAGNILTFNIRNSGSNVANLSTNALSSERWYYLTVTYSANNVRMYLNGAPLIGQDNSAVMTSPSAVFTIGRRSTSSSNFFSGKIDEFMVFDKQLSDSEVLSLYITGNIAYRKDLFLRFENNANDDSGNNRTVTLNGTSYSSEVALKTRTAVT